MSRSPSSDRADSTSLNLTTLSLDSIVPYWRNPRRITDEAVNAVAESIRRYGYQQPIVVDAENVIIIGHTRYAALRRLDYREVPVRVESELTPKQVKHLRAIDNRTAEYTNWDFDTLVDEMQDLDANLGQSFFADIALDIEEVTGTPFIQTEPVDATTEASGTGEPIGTMDADAAEFICPSCFHSWETTVTPAQIRKGRIEEDA